MIIYGQRSKGHKKKNYASLQHLDKSWSENFLVRQNFRQTKFFVRQNFFYQERDKAKKNSEWFVRLGRVPIGHICSLHSRVCFTAEIPIRGRSTGSTNKSCWESWKVYEEHDTKIGPISDREMRPAVMYGVSNIWERIVW